MLTVLPLFPNGAGMLVWHAFTVLPLKLTVQVPHSPFLHEYLISTPADFATRDSA
jgi:hypothetical protein